MSADEDRLEPAVTLKVDRHALVDIASNKDVLAALLRISYSTNGIRNTDQLLGRLLELIFEIIPAQRGSILLIGGTQEDFISAFYRPRAFSVSPTIATETLRDRLAMSCSDASESVLCVPLRVFDANLGVIYVASSGAAAFGTNDLHLLIAISAAASLALQHTRFVERLADENQRLNDEINVGHDMVGESERMREVYEFIRKAGPKDSTVLITGESGTGKELVARALHRNSRRSTGPFVAVNCAAIAETLVESELFGNEKGAFTGAFAQRKGKIEAADGGTLFLDEVGELSMSAQAALLRVLQEREFQRVGGTRSTPIDVRVIAATNRDLPARIKEGRFRQDLYFRLQVVGIRMPSLSERRADIPMLAMYFIQKYRHVRVVSGLTPEAQQLLLSYNWPGNVRQLENAIEHALVLGELDYVRPEDLPEALRETKLAEHTQSNSYHSVVSATKRSLVLGALGQVHGNIQEAARILDLSPSYLHRLLRNLDIK